jgi:hypothetical protein
MGELIFFKHFILFQCLHGVDLARVGFLDEPDFTESTFTDYFDGSEIF